jgi:hypothetical protein
MIKKQQKWIALFVAITFIWLMQVTTMPVAAAGTTAQVSSAGAEQGPDYLEAIGQKAAPAKKKSILPYVLIGVGVLAVTAAVLFLVVLKNYDITGSWLVTYGSGGHDTYTFVGDKKVGTYTTSDYFAKGTYAVDGKNVTITWTGWTGGVHIIQTSWVLTGKFDSKTTMSGTYTGADWFGPFSGTWTAVKQ